MAHTTDHSNHDMAAGALDARRRAAYDAARRRHRSAWRNLVVGLTTLALVVAAVIWLAALV